jgi:hypothetical protein
MNAETVHSKTTKLLSRLVVIGLICLGGISTSHAEIIHVDWVERAFAHSASIAPKKILEVCDRSKQGDAIAWQFKSSAATDFNIHYHVGKQVSYPKKSTGVVTASGKLAIPADRNYCWMWTNKGSEPVNMSVTLKK